MLCKNNVVELIGKKFNLLTVVAVGERIYYDNQYHTSVQCLCDCGKSIIAIASRVKSGEKKSCGCFMGGVKNSRSSHFRLYQIWQNMKDRCYNSNNGQYKNYGGRGITVWGGWLNSPDDFCEWAINNGYNKDLTLERVDVNSGYSPDNCTWIPGEHQARNKRMYSNNKTGITGVVKRVDYAGRESYFSYWQENGKAQARTFSVNKYGDTVAFEMAVNARKDAMVRLRDAGIVYGEFHGLSPEQINLDKEKKTQ